MRAFRNLLLFFGALSVAACSDEEGGASITDIPPLAYTRFVNTVPDTGNTDWRFVDILEYSPAAFNLAYRGFTPYQGTQPGTHTLRIFPTSQDINITSQRLIDQEVTLEAGRYYTIVHAGYARAGSTPADQLIIIQDDHPTVTAGDFAVRSLNLSSASAIDVYATPTTTSPLPGTPLFANVAFGNATGYTQLDTGAVALRATEAGTPATELAAASAPAGAAGNAQNNLTTIGGSRMSGSVILGIFTPRTVDGSAAPQTSAFDVPAWVYIIDRHPR